MLKNILLSLTLLLLAVSPATARTITDPAAGFTIDIPNDWQQIPQPDFDRTMSVVNAGNVHPIIGFEPASHPRHFQYPYVVITRLDYSGGMTMNSVDEDTLKGIVAGASGTSVADIKKTMTPKAANLVSSLDSKVLSYFTSPPGFLMDMDVTGTNNLSFHAHGIGLVGKNRALMLNIYYEKNAAASMQPVVSTLASGFSLDPSQKIPFREPMKPQTILAIAIGTIAAIGLVIAAIVIIIWLALRKPRPRPIT